MIHIQLTVVDLVGVEMPTEAEAMNNRTKTLEDKEEVVVVVVRYLEGEGELSLEGVEQLSLEARAATETGALMELWDKTARKKI